MNRKLGAEVMVINLEEFRVDRFLVMAVAYVRLRAKLMIVRWIGN